LRFGNILNHNIILYYEIGIQIFESFTSLKDSLFILCKNGLNLKIF
jgi:hypothetical protein